MNSLDSIVSIIKESRSVCILAHISPDGDAVGSSIAMCHALSGLGKDVYVSLDEYARCFDFLFEGIKIYNNEDVDLVIVLDSSTKDRVYDNYNLLEKDNVLCIDHHLKNEMFGRYNYVIEDSPAVCEVVFDIINDLGFTIDKKIGSALITGIITDTGGFRYSEVSSKTFKIAAYIKDLGVNISKIYYNVFDLKTKAQVSLSSISMSRAKYYYDERVIVSYLTKKDFSDCGALVGDHEGIVNMLRNIEGVKIACFLREDDDDSYKISVRSIEEIDVSEFCIGFSGGGHKNAAGCTICGKYDEVIRKIVDGIGEFYGWNNSLK